MEQWNPEQEERGRQQPLWLDAPTIQARRRQGERRALVSGRERLGWRAPANSYARSSAGFIASVRSDFGQPELPFYFVQIGRFVRAAIPRDGTPCRTPSAGFPSGSPIRPSSRSSTSSSTTRIHVGTQGLKRAGQRLARIAQRELFREVGATTPTLDRVSKGPHNTLVVRFKGVNMGTPARPRSALDGRAQGMGGAGCGAP